MTQQMPLPLTPIKTSFGMQLISLISIKSRKDLREGHSSHNKKKSVMMMNMLMQKSNFPLIQIQKKILHIQFISHHFTPRCHKKSFLSPNIWETLSESTKRMIIAHNKKVKLNKPTPYPSGSKTKPNPTLGKSTPAPQQVHEHSQDEPTEEPPPDTSTQTLVNKYLAESGIDPTDIQNVMPASYAKSNISHHESSRQIQPHQRYVFASVNQSKHHNFDAWIPLTPQVQYQPLSKLPVMTHTTASVLIAEWKPSAIIPSTSSWGSKIVPITLLHSRLAKTTTPTL